MSENGNYPAIQLMNVSKVYKQGKVEVHALHDVSLSIGLGRFVAIMGASGSGKSTILHIMAGLTTPTSGEVRLLGKTLNMKKDAELTRFRRKSVGLVFQDFNLLPTMNALENVCLPMIIDGAKFNDVREDAEKLLKLVGLEDRINHHPDELSGGQQQRVAIARSLINRAPLILADEPTGNLDSKTGEQVLTLMRRLTQNSKRSIVMVTHDPKAAAYADQVITVSDGQILEQLGMMPQAL